MKFQLKNILYDVMYHIISIRQSIYYISSGELCGNIIKLLICMYISIYARIQILYYVLIEPLTGQQNNRV